jgi:hypothetical protein
LRCVSYASGEPFVIDSIESFWLLYNNVRMPSGIPMGATYYLSREVRSGAAGATQQRLFVAHP